MKCEKLDVWKVSARLAADVYRQLAELKDYGFKDQIYPVEYVLRICFEESVRP